MDQDFKLDQYDSSDTPSSFYQSGQNFMKLYDADRSLSTLDRAIQAFQSAIQLVMLYEDEDNILPACFDSLGTSFMHRFQTIGNIADIAEAINFYRRAVEMSQSPVQDDSHLACIRADRLIRLAGSLNACFALSLNANDISEAILTQQSAIELRPDSIPSKPTELHTLGGYMKSLYDLNPLESEHISSAILAYRSSVCLTAQEDPALPSRLMDLGVAYTQRYRRNTRAAKDIAKAISAHSQAVDLTPTGSQDKDRNIQLASRLCCLAESLSCRFDNPPRRIPRDDGDIDEAIEVQEEATDILTAKPDSAVDFNSNSKAALAESLSTLGTFLRLRFEYGSRRLEEDITQAIALQKRACQLIAPDDSELHPDAAAAQYAHNLGCSLVSQFSHCGANGKKKEDISRAILVLQRSIHLTPPTSKVQTQSHTVTSPNIDLPRAQRHTDLGNAYMDLYDLTRDPSDKAKGKEHWKASTGIIEGPPSSLLEAALGWAEIFQDEFRAPQSIEAYASAVPLLRRVAGLEMTVEERHKKLVEIAHVTARAAAEAFAQGNPSQALEWLEQGRALVWTQLGALRTRTSLDDLAALHPTLAKRFFEISSALEEAGARLEDLRQTSLVERFEAHDASIERARLAREWDSIINEIRTVASPTGESNDKLFTGFLRPTSASSLLKGIPPNGVVVLINVHTSRCDALALISGRLEPVHIPLKGFSSEEATALRRDLKGYLNWQGLMGRGGVIEAEVEERNGTTDREIRGPRLVNDDDDEADHVRSKSPMHRILESLWVGVVRPIFDQLGYLDTPCPQQNRPRIWWCATGPAAFLPMHAAGIHSNAGTGKNRTSSGTSTGLCVSDFAISSYTPTVSALLDKVRPSRTMLNAEKDYATIPARDVVPASSATGILLVSQHTTPNLPPLPGTTREIAAVQRALTAAKVPSIALNAENATVDRVKDGMSGGCVHFACHASQHPTRPLQSAFHLADGNLSLGDIMQLNLSSTSPAHHPDSTAADEDVVSGQAELAFLSACETSLGDEQLEEEVVHLAAGMLAAGYRGVVGTMWSIRDKSATRLAEDFYKRLLLLPSDDSVKIGVSEHEFENRLRMIESEKKQESSMSLYNASGRAAEALDWATRRMRAEMGDEEEGLLAWIPYVHFGV